MCVREEGQNQTVDITTVVRYERIFAEKAGRVEAVVKGGDCIDCPWNMTCTFLIIRGRLAEKPWCGCLAGKYVVWGRRFMEMVHGNVTWVFVSCICMSAEDTWVVQVP